MNIDFKEFISATMILFAVIDVIGNIPLILVLRQKFKIIESDSTVNPRKTDRTDHSIKNIKVSDISELSEKLLELS